MDTTGRITTVAGTGETGYDGDGRPATSARVYEPTGVAVDESGNFYILGTRDRRVRRVDVEGRITTVAGTGERGYEGDNGPATSARFSSPAGISSEIAAYSLQL